MHGVAWMMSGLPDSQLWHLGSYDVGIPIQAFGVIVAIGVLIGASVLRRYAEWHGIEDVKIRELTGWVTICGFLGAHLFDVIAYQWDDLQHDPVLLIQVWKGISSYGGFIGGSLGFAFYTWWKRLPWGLMGDVTIVGLLPAFTIGRIGCTTVSDHVGALVDPDKWYSFLAVDYKGDFLTSAHVPYAGASHLAWNLGLIEFLYLVPINLVLLWLAFRPSKQEDKPWTQGRLNAGLVAVLLGVLYAPVRFFLDFLRPDESDPRYFDLTFAQWASIIFFGVAAYAAFLVFTRGKPAEPVTRTAGEAQRRLKQLMLKEPAAEGEKEVAKK